MKALLSIRNLVITEPQSGKTIVDDFSLDLYPGQITAIAGWSGSGKSTIGLALFHLVQDNLKMEYSSFVYQGKNMTGLTDAEWNTIRGKKIVLIPQNPGMAFHPYINMENQLKEFYRLKSPGHMPDFTKIMQNLDIANPVDKLKAVPGKLSGGERQRLVMAMFAELEPDIVIADEPTTALDAVSEKKVLKSLCDMVKNTGSLVLISHDLRIIRNLADRVIILHQGKIEEEFSLKEKKIPKLKTGYAREIFAGYE